MRDTGLVGPSSPLHPAQKHAGGPAAADQGENGARAHPAGDLSSSCPAHLFPLTAASTLQGRAPNGAFADRRGRHAVAHIDDFEALQQQIAQGGALLHTMEAQQEFSLHQVKL